VVETRRITRPTWLHAGKTAPSLQLHARYTTRAILTYTTIHCIFAFSIPFNQAPRSSLPSCNCNHGRRVSSHHGGRLRLPQTRGRSRGQADPPHLSGPLEAIHRRWTVQRAGYRWVRVPELQRAPAGSNTSSASCVKPPPRAPNGSSCPSTPRPISRARCSKKRRPMSSKTRRSASRLARVGRRIGSRSGLRCRRIC